MQHNIKVNDRVFEYVLISNELPKEASPSALARLRLVSNRTITFCFSIVRLLGLTGLSESSSNVTCFKKPLLIFLQTPKALFSYTCLLHLPELFFSNDTNALWPFVGWYYAPGGRGLFFPWSTEGPPQTAGFHCAERSQSTGVQNGGWRLEKGFCAT